VQEIAADGRAMGLDTGNRGAGNAPVLSCNVSMPKEVINGPIVTGAVDSYYADNHGSCTYTFLCFRK
jgi:hypothetical protein